MVIVGESINGVINEVRDAILSRNQKFIIDLARSQMENGAHILDVNGAVASGNEVEDLVWVVKTIQNEMDVSLMLDSGNPKALHAAMAAHRGCPIINSISGEKWKIEKILPIVSQKNCGVVALCLDDKGIPPTPEGRLEVAMKLVKDLTDVGVKEQAIYIDPLVLSIGTDSQAGMISIDSLKLIRQNLPEVNTILAVSNISFGLPCRRLLNRTFLATAIVLGVDAFIVDVRDRSLMGTIWAANLLRGNDEGCGDYLRAYRKGMLV